MHFSMEMDTFHGKIYGEYGINFQIGNIVNLFEWFLGPFKEIHYVTYLKVDPFRSAETVRRIAHIERFFASYLTSSWVPHYPMLQNAIYSSQFSSHNGTLWTIVNRLDQNSTGPQMMIKYDPSLTYFDVYHGEKAQQYLEDGFVTLSFDIEALGYGAILAVSHFGLMTTLLTGLDR